MSDTTAEAAIFAKQALKEMALTKAAPTPENFKLFYDAAKTSHDALKKTSIHLNVSSSEITPVSTSTPVIPVGPHKESLPKDPLAIRAVNGAEGLKKNTKTDLEISKTSLSGVLGIVEAFLTNLSDLYPDNPSLKEQVDIIRDALLAPEDVARLSTARKSLSRLRTPQIHSHLSAAKIIARQMADSFLSHMIEAEDTTENLVSLLRERNHSLINITDPEALSEFISHMISNAQAAQDLLGTVSHKMLSTREKAQEAELSIRDLESRLLKASEEAKHDYLTGLLNRRGLDEELHRIFSAADDSHPPTIALLDIDNFKSINDSLGHDAGDKALKMLSVSIQEILGPVGSPARMGGEEFLIVFPELSISQTQKTVQTLQRSLTTRLFMEAEGATLITFSAGIAQRLPGETAASTIERADEAMYIAKRKGKNRVEISPTHQEVIIE